MYSGSVENTRYKTLAKKSGLHYQVSYLSICVWNIKIVIKFDFNNALHNLT